MNEMCRFCLITTENLACRIIDDSEILLKLKNGFGLDIMLIDPFPNRLCLICTQKVNDSYNFKQQIIENEQNLLEMYKNNHSDVNFDVKIKVENVGTDLDIKEEPDSFPDNDSIIHNEDYNKQIPKQEKKRLKVKKKATKTSSISKKKQRTIKTVSDHNINPLKCVTCFKAYESQIELSKHYKNDHSLDQFDDENQSVSDDKYTILSNDNKVNYKCNSCGDVFEQKPKIVDHIISHMHERPFICKLCGKTYKTVYEIVRHGRVHNGSKLICSFGCGYSSPHGGAMRDHEKRHTNDHNYKCKICGKGFLVKTWFEQHQNIHNNIKPYKCDVCSRAFYMHRYLMTHRSKMHPEVSAIRRYTCLQCNFTCDSKKAFDTHSVEQHKTGTEIKMKHLCDVCGKAFSRVDCLKNHKNSHLGLKPFTCSTCNKQFATKFNLKVHERVHTNDMANKPQCNTCGKHFSQKSTMLRHRKRRHPDEI